MNLARVHGKKRSTFARKRFPLPAAKRGEESQGEG